MGGTAGLLKAFVWDGFVAIAALMEKKMETTIILGL